MNKFDEIRTCIIIILFVILNTLCVLKIVLSLMQDRIYGEGQRWVIAPTYGILRAVNLYETMNFFFVLRYNL